MSSSGAGCDCEGLYRQLLDAMINANRARAAEVVESALAGGIPPAEVITHILDPAIVELGTRWEGESISLAQNFIASKIAEDALLRCLPDREDPDCRKGVAVIGNIEDDFHSLGRRTVGLFLGAAGWQVVDLGNDVPAEQFLEKALEVGARVIGVSAMMQTTAINIKKLRELIDREGERDHIKLAVGGAVFNWRPELVTEVGGDGTTRNAIGADQLFTALQEQALARELSS
ncbi:cobalamin B12-binding domain-containing protein [Geomonas edaphica]|uniref:cobalamin B12-binding domain-containing protein n=1 Tax=Geomonas edaphica TaxID=2570226 RepID=UPI0010A8D38D|nr:cobalamin-dependent protein [Geomonas edaphica]